MNEISRLLIIGGIVFIIIGLLLKFMGRLPGDIVIRRENFTFYFPIVTSIVVSIILSIIFFIIGKIR